MNQFAGVPNQGVGENVVPVKKEDGGEEEKRAEILRMFDMGYLLNEIQTSFEKKGFHLPEDFDSLQRVISSGKAFSPRDLEGAKNCYKSLKNTFTGPLAGVTFADAKRKETFLAIEAKLEKIQVGL